MKGRKYQRSWQLRKAEGFKSSKGKQISKTKWQQTGHYRKYYMACNSDRFEEIWNDFLKKVRIFRKDLTKKVKSNIKNEKMILDNLIEYVNIVTQFYDSVFPKAYPASKREVLVRFYQDIRAVVRRDNVVTSYKNMTQTGERVTANNLLVGDAKKITEDQIKYYPVVQDIDGELYGVTVIMRPISIWKQGRVCDINNKRAVLIFDKLQSIVESSRDILIEECDELLAED